MNRTTNIEDRTIDVQIGRLREAIVGGEEPDPIRTAQGEGYIFDDAAILGFEIAGQVVVFEQADVANETP